MALDNMLMPYPSVLLMSQTLWEMERAPNCPGILPFNLVMPERFTEPRTNSTYPLPPSYDTGLSLSNLQVCCAYKLTVVATRTRWAPNRTLSVDILHVPRHLPSRAIMDAPFPFFQTFKSTPEEWRQISATLSPRASSNEQPIDCDVC